MPCPRCGTPLHAGGIYEPHPAIVQAIHAKDGLIALGIANMLTEKHIAFESSTYIGDLEVDMVATVRNEQVLLECKMFKCGKDMDSVAGNLNTLVKQLAERVEAAGADGKPFSRAIGVMNYPKEVLVEGIEKLSRKMSELRARHNIELCPVYDLQERLFPTPR
jgi:hypothetical protein